MTQILSILTGKCAQSLETGPSAAACDRISGSQTLIPPPIFCAEDRGWAGMRQCSSTKLLLTGCLLPPPPGGGHARNCKHSSPDQNVSFQALSPLKFPTIAGDSAFRQRRIGAHRLDCAPRQGWGGGWHERSGPERNVRLPRHHHGQHHPDIPGGLYPLGTPPLFPPQHFLQPCSP